MKTKGRFAVYGLAGIYLLLTAYNMLKGLPQAYESEYILLIVFMIVFAVVGIVLAGMSILMSYKLFKNLKYDKK